jgi:hypothetical protein
VCARSTPVSALAGGVNLVRARLSCRKEDASAAIQQLVNEKAVKRGGTRSEPTLSLAGTDDDDS